MRDGLTTAEAHARLARDGPNVLPVQRPPSPVRELAGQMFHFFAILLWIAGGLAFVAGMPALGIAIFVVVVVNGAFAFVQEQRAERAAEALRRMLPRRSVVVRDGRPRTVDAAELVVGDVVVLGAGDRITADLRLLEASALSIDASTLTGESVGVRPASGEVAFAGTFVQEGEARGEVLATGARTRLAEVAALTRRAPHAATPLARELARLVRIIAIIAASVGLAFFLVGLAVGLPAADGFLFAIGVTVALVPEGLLPTVTLSLALGARRMAGHHALVRRLDAVETLGATSYVCTDKTGTLTQNRMSVVRAWTPRGEARVRGEGYEPEGKVDAPAEARAALESLARVAARCSTGHAVQRDGEWVAEGDPMEAALDVFARRLAIDIAADARRSPVTARFPFDPRRKRMSIVAGDELLVKGAPDALLPRCREVGDASDVADALGREGLRVLAVAHRPAPAGGDADACERDLELLGLLGLEDPPRPGAREAIASCRRAGVRVAMITGDHPTTATAIAREVGLLVASGWVIEGKDLPADEAILGATLDRDGMVVCRVSPEEKLRIARALQARGHIVAMTGDGVNDAPALRQANVGVAMGRSGTDVAREAADLVLLDDDFATIVLAIAQGRAAFVNLRRALGYHLTDNVAELAPFVVWALSAGRFPLALGVLQILCLDLLTDQLPALALGAEPATARAMTVSARERHLVDRALLVRSLLVIGPIEAAFALAAFVTVLLRAGPAALGSPPDPRLLAEASGAAFTAIVIGQIANAFGVRGRTAAKNLALYGACAFALATLVVLLEAPPLAALLHHASPPWQGLLVAALAGPAVWLGNRAWRRDRPGSTQPRAATGNRPRPSRWPAARHAPR